MKVISVPDPTWSDRLTCERCGTVFEADQDDLDYDSWKTSGYWFNDSAVTEMRYTVKCPTCPDKYVRVNDDDIHILIRDKLVAARRKKKLERGY